MFNAHNTLFWVKIWNRILFSKETGFKEIFVVSKFPWIIIIDIVIAINTGNYREIFWIPNYDCVVVWSSGDPDSPIDLSCPDSVLVSSDPKQDHNYSSSSFQRCSSHSSSSSLSSLDETGCDSGQGRRAGSEGFHSDEDSEEERNPCLPSLPVRHPLTVKCPLPVKRARHESRPELDEELKEAAGSLLHLAGIRSGLDLSKRTAKSKTPEKPRKWTV